MAAVGRRHEGRTPGAGIVAGAGALDLDDVGAKIGENLAGPWPGQNPGKLQHAQPANGPGMRRPSCNAARHESAARASNWPRAAQFCPHVAMQLSALR